MNQLKLNVKQAIEQLNMSKSTLYNWMNDGRLKFQESPRGRILLLTQQEVEEIRELNQSYASAEQSDTVQEAYYAVQENLIKDTPDVLENRGLVDTDLIIELTNKIAGISERAGQANLLTDNLFEAKQDFKFWQDKYFEGVNQYNILQESARQFETDLHSAVIKNDGLQESLKTQKVLYDKLLNELSDKCEIVNIQREKIASIEEQLKSSSNEINRLNHNLSETNRLKDEYHSKLAELADIVSSQNSKIIYLENEINNKNNYIDSINANMIELKDVISANNQTISDLEEEVNKKSSLQTLTNELSKDLKVIKDELQDYKNKYFELEELNTQLVSQLEAKNKKPFWKLK